MRVALVVVFVLAGSCAAEYSIPATSVGRLRDVLVIDQPQVVFAATRVEDGTAVWVRNNAIRFEKGRAVDGRFRARATQVNDFLLGGLIALAPSLAMLGGGCAAMAAVPGAQASDARAQQQCMMTQSCPFVIASQAGIDRAVGITFLSLGSIGAATSLVFILISGKRYPAEGVMNDRRWIYFQ
jgi:hypothetical protein